MTHKDPDGDGIGSMLALGKTLLNAKKDVVLSSEAPVTAPVSFLKGSEMIVQNIDFEKNFDAIIVLDCGEKNRVGGANGFLDGTCPLINIDHHETNDFFGDLNLVDQKSSSTGELVYNIIKTAGLSVDLDVAENIFAAIQTDTGSFRYENTTPACLKIAAEMIEFGVKPWQISQKMMDGYNPSRLRLLGMALDTIEFHYDGKICIMMISLDMLKKANANWEDSERFVDYPRSVLGVEIAVLIRQKGKNICKFSLRSVNKVNVAQLASGFGGGGHAKAAGFECKGDIGVVKRNFLGEAGQVLNGISD
ncbi:MAG TPA: DHH family phosphoesterase [Desulfobacteraceae bacterium]|nr:DHH family phosphoesterase [Desulfobacteraceae bacterium]